MDARTVTDRQGGTLPSLGVAEYLVDRYQRTILFWDVLRKRGNTYLDHLRAGMPPILIFDHETVLDGRNFTPPVNYAMVRIIDRRRPAAAGVAPGEERRTTRKGEVVDRNGRPARPIVIIDPRAGHGPGIGGSKLDSQIGIALEFGHPVYFILFYPEPVADQRLVDVHQAEVRFLEKIAELHADAPRPAVIGNCQAGWAAALIAADRPELAGPLIFNGSPLSYWGGTEGRNPMRYRGGLYGGIWLTSLACDLGNGTFDGAHLVAGFEDLNPANTLWSKLRNLFVKVDTEEQRFLDFERWWGGFYRMNWQEIHYIVDRLFIGNELEQGRLRLEDGRLIDMKNIRSPVFAFASAGDNITPPPQALNWIGKVYGSVAEIRRCNQIIIYMVHEKVGHLGIFVSGSVARKEHRQILANLGWLEYLQPGLYEMVIDEPPRHPRQEDWRVRFVQREMADLDRLGDGRSDEQAFVQVNRVSRFNDAVYSLLLSPWLRLAINEPLAEAIRNLHPLRMQRYLLSDMNPFLLPVTMLAEPVKNHRRPVAADNPWVGVEQLCSNLFELGLNCYRDLRDQGQEFLFKTVYDNFLTASLPQQEGAVQKQPVPAPAGDDSEGKREKARLRRLAGKGTFAEAAIRVMTAVAGRDRMLDAREFQAAERILQSHGKLRALTPGEVKVIIREQANILALVPQKALRALGEMGLTAEERRDLLTIAETIALADELGGGSRERKILASLQQVLQKKDIIPGRRAKKA